jgi:peptidoglycan hydrolase-like protein with peptidoglycan-binding domain
MQNLALTSPHTRGPAVKAAQKTLKKHGYYGGRIDGVFGPVTVSSVRRAKHYMGYAPKAINGMYGPTLDAFLKGTKKLPKVYAARRKFRLKAKAQQAAKANKRKLVLAAAVAEIGTKESPAGSNRVKYTEWYNLVGAWCAIFTTWAATKHGIKSFNRLKAQYAYVPYMLNDATAGRNGLYVVANPLPGDLVIFNWDKVGVPEHVGFFEEWTDRKGGNFTSVEGNTSFGNDSNGGAVMRRDRNVSQGVTFVRYEV